ncbi:hypothetical protein BS17DRAFT_782304 [Gyrodon lividus]|nr:hypothetical protein BS17DRAFT_782304 [Gyrodon lividus]
MLKFITLATSPRPPVSSLSFGASTTLGQRRSPTIQGGWCWFYEARRSGLELVFLSRISCRTFLSSHFFPHLASLAPPLTGFIRRSKNSSKRRL